MGISDEVLAVQVDLAIMMRGLEEENEKRKTYDGKRSPLNSLLHLQEKIKSGELDAGDTINFGSLN